MRRIALTACAAFALAVPAVPLHAGAPSVTDVQVTRTGAGWRFEVTVAHDDTGWDHYADGWSIYTPEGRELGYRKLLHPHVEEQPFTRTLSGVLIPPWIHEVMVRAHDTVHGEGPPFVVKLPKD
jgi:hypothetical protein